LFVLSLISARAQVNTEPITRFSFNDGMLFDDRRHYVIKAYNATFVNDRFGNSNSACYLQGGEGSFLNLGTSDDLKPVVGSISIWINISHAMMHGKGVESNPILYTRAHNDIDHNEAYYIGYDLATENLNVNTTYSKEKQITIYSAKPFKCNEWHHIVMCYDDDFLRFYIDGKLQSKLPKGFRSRFCKGDSVLVGNLNSIKNKRFYNGMVDDIAFYDRVLSQEEVQALFKAPDPNKNHFIVELVFIGIGALVLIVVCFFLIRLRIKHLVKVQMQRNQLELHALEQEIKMLKAQMDPHFIFNSLNTILQFIVTKENEKAELYLTKFSKLIRKLLESNTNEGINLTDELDVLKKYLEIETLRFNKIIQPMIEIEPGIDAYKTYIPHLMIQPFVENAIWHGLRAKEGEKKLWIKFEKRDEKTLFCTIEDNGIGRSAESHIKENRSLAINFIKQRLELMSKKYGGHYSLEIIDKVNAKNEALGTKVEITLPIIQR
jgi:two-component sensor histidine kinase